MAKLPSIRRLRTEDYPGADANFGKLIQNLNSFMESTWLALSRNLTVSENLRAEFQTLSIVAEPTYPIAVTPAIQGVTCVMIAQIFNSTTQGAPSGTALTAGVTLDWSQSSTGIQINKITGLTAGQNYQVKLLMVGE